MVDFFETVSKTNGQFHRNTTEVRYTRLPELREKAISLYHNPQATSNDFEEIARQFERQIPEIAGSYCLLGRDNLPMKNSIRTRIQAEMERIGITYPFEFSPYYVPTQNSYRQKRVALVTPLDMPSCMAAYDSEQDYILLRHDLYAQSKFEFGHIPALTLRRFEKHEHRHRINNKKTPMGVIMKDFRGNKESETILKNTNRKVAALRWADEISAYVDSADISIFYLPDGFLSRMLETQVYIDIRSGDGNFHSPYRAPGIKQAAQLLYTYAAAREMNIPLGKVMTAGAQTYKKLEQDKAHDHMFPTAIINAMYQFVVQEGLKTEHLDSQQGDHHEQIVELGKRYLLRSYLKTQIMEATTYQVLSEVLGPVAKRQLFIGERPKTGDIAFVLYDISEKTYLPTLYDPYKLNIALTFEHGLLSLKLCFINRITGVGYPIPQNMERFFPYEAVSDLANEFFNALSQDTLAKIAYALGLRTTTKQLAPATTYANNELQEQFMSLLAQQRASIA